MKSQTESSVPHACKARFGTWVFPWDEMHEFSCGGFLEAKVRVDDGKLPTGGFSVCEFSVVWRMEI